MRFTKADRALGSEVIAAVVLFALSVRTDSTWAAVCYVAAGGIFCLVAGINVGRTRW